MKRYTGFKWLCFTSFKWLCFSIYCWGLTMDYYEKIIGDCVFSEELGFMLFALIGTGLFLTVYVLLLMRAFETTEYTARDMYELAMINQFKYEDADACSLEDRIIKASSRGLTEIVLHTLSDGEIKKLIKSGYDVDVEIENCDQKNEVKIYWGAKAYGRCRRHINLSKCGRAVENDEYYKIKDRGGK